jgi:energy-coupling factor transporter ATP-binding protein EcfA2
MNGPIAELTGVSYAYPGTEIPALKDIDLSLKKGDLMGIVGPSGAGKSSLGYALSGFIPHFFQGDLQGELTLCGARTVDTTLAELAGQIGIVVQNPFNQISGARYTVREEVAFGLENLGTDPADIDSRVEQMLKQFKLEDLRDRSPYELSGGQQQRLALASIFAMKPDLLILDEPTSQLDPAGTEEVFESVYALTRHSDTTVVLISHKLEWLAQFSSRVIALVDGEIKIDRDPETVLSDPRLEDWGIGSTQYTQSARIAVKKGLIEAKKLPVTLEQAKAVFS